MTSIPRTPVCTPRRRWFTPRCRRDADVDLWSLALGTLGGAAAVRGLGHLREHRIAPAGLADLVNWAFMVDDGVVLQKDGSLLAGWRYHGPDVSAATPEELDALSRHVNDALLPFTDDWMFHVDAIRRPAVAYAPSRFPDPVTQLIDDERRATHAAQASRQFRSEEHTSELQSQSNLVCRLLLEKKKKINL